MPTGKTRRPGRGGRGRRGSELGRGGRRGEQKKRLCCCCRYFKTKNGFNFSRAPKQTWIEGREGDREGVRGLRWKSNTAECHQPTSQTIGGRAPETMFHFVGCESRDKPHTHHSVSCVTPTWNKESSNSSGRWRRGTRTPCAFFAGRPPLFVN